MLWSTLSDACQLASNYLDLICKYNVGRLENFVRTDVTFNLLGWTRISDSHLSLRPIFMIINHERHCA